MHNIHYYWLNHLDVTHCQNKTSTNSKMTGPSFNCHISADYWPNNLEIRMELPVDIIINSAKSQVNQLETEKVIPENV